MISLLRTQSPLASGRKTQVSRVVRQESGPQDCVTISAPSQGASTSSLAKQAGRGLLLACALVGGAAGVVSTAHAQQAQVQVRKGVKFDKTEAQVVQQTRNTLTADQLGPGQPRFTAVNADPTQSSKRYHDTKTLAVDDSASSSTAEGGTFFQCAKMTGEGVCQTMKPNQIRYSVLSCVYRNEGDSKLYRVTQKSYQHNYTNAMQRNVCGGHELRYNSAAMTYAPHQTNQQGQQLFLNPANILRIDKVN